MHGQLTQLMQRITEYVEMNHTDIISLLCSAGGSVCSTVCAVEDDITQCASSAANGFKAWSSQTCYQRAQVLLKYDSFTFRNPQHILFQLLSRINDHTCVFACFSQHPCMKCFSTLTMSVFANRLVSILGLHGKCVLELCELCEASCSPSTLVRLLQYYSTWAQLRDTLITNWTQLGEEAGMCFTNKHFGFRINFF